MDSKVNYALVGLFVIILSIVLMASILWLSTGKEQKLYTSYIAYFSESVSGLNLKASVKYRGVEVGYVKDISLVPDRYDVVRLLLDIERPISLKQDTVAILSSQGLTGLAYIELTGGSNESPSLKIMEDERYAEIKTQPSLLVRVDSAISTLLEKLGDVSGISKPLLYNLSEIAKTINGLMSEKNVVAATNILKHIEQLTTTFAARSDSIDTILASVAQVLAKSVQVTIQLPPVLIELEQTLATTRKTLVEIEQTATAFAQTANIVNTLAKNNQGNLQQASDALTTAASGLHSTVEDTNQGLKQLTRQTLPEMTAAIRDLRELLNALQSFSQNLQHKPNMMLFGKPKVSPGPGE